MPTNSTDPQDNTQSNPQGANGETPAPTWESILSELPDDQKALYEQHTHGLKSALDAERQQRQDLAKQLRDASQQLEAGSAAKAPVSYTHLTLPTN